MPNAGYCLKYAKDCFDVVIKARAHAVHMTPVILLSDGYIANGAEPWRFPNSGRPAAYRSKFKKGLGEVKMLFFLINEMKSWYARGLFQYSGIRTSHWWPWKQDVTGNVNYELESSTYGKTR
jgi:2-oxoglutarate ferredoxin oxidoreductase subunit alpha